MIHVPPIFQFLTSVWPYMYIVVGINTLVAFFNFFLCLVAHLPNAAID